MKLESNLKEPWICGCGALNAYYRKTCGRCNKKKSKTKIKI